MAKHKHKKPVLDMRGLSASESCSKETTVDSSPVVYQREKINRPLSINKRPLTDRQKEFLALALDKKCKMLFISGPAGSSKSFMAVYAGLMLMNDKKVSDILYIRSAVESADNSLGFLPGEMKDKMDPYMVPLQEKIEELLTKNDISMLEKEDRLIPMPVGFVRGRNWNAKCIIADEAQNFSEKETISIITIIGEFSKIFVLGDPMQSDINGRSGFTKVMSQFDDEEARNNGIYTFQFTEDDIVRSELVKFIIKRLNSLKK